MDWYQEFIEEGIRPHVRLLRENGFNTISSCEHQMTVHCDFSLQGELQRLHRLLTVAGYHNYEMNVHVRVLDLRPYNTIEIRFSKEDD